jgi:hypothetical protein
VSLWVNAKPSEPSVLANPTRIGYQPVTGVSTDAVVGLARSLFATTRAYTAAPGCAISTNATSSAARPKLSVDPASSQTSPSSHTVVVASVAPST